MRNIHRMAAKARASHVRFRPHFKTHGSAAHVGDLVLVIPAHACLTAHALRNYVTLDGEVLTTPD